jgi:hypothetical protein
MTGEAALVALAAAIYLFDCVVLLERGQALIEARGRGLALSFGSRHYQISGKAVALMNPLGPFFFAIRSLPLFSPAAKESVNVSKAAAVLGPLASLPFLQLLIVFVVLPYCLYRAPGWPFFIALVLAYLNAIVMLALLILRFRRYAIPARPLASLGFGWIVCLPLSVNCLRAAGVGIPVAVDATRAIRFLGERETARNDLAAQVAEAMQEVEENDERHGRLAALALQLKPGADHGRL